MTAKEQPLERVRGLSEAEAADALRLLDARHDLLGRRLDDAPLEDEEMLEDLRHALELEDLAARDIATAGAATPPSG